MALGPGKYDDECTTVRARLEAEGVILIVFGGKHGGGFSCQATLETTLRLPAILRNMAGEIEKDITK
jgi:hypothetical protein